mgnify:CR=1 FL=1
MATGIKPHFESGREENGSQAEEIASFLKSKKLEPASLILLDMMIPFKRQISAFLTLAEPLTSLLIGEEKTGKILGFSRGENSFEALKEALERGEE